MQLAHIIGAAGETVELLGVAVIVLGIVLATARFGHSVVRREWSEDTYATYRRGIGRSLLLGLELLVAGDIIRTVAIDPTLASVAVLAVIVVIRTFLSWSVEVELTGRWPWQRAGQEEVEKERP